MINIQEIRNSNSFDTIVDLLLDEKKQPFKIFAPKQTVLFSNTNEDIANDYARLAYVGHKLSLFSDFFKYEVVYPNEHKSVYFELEAYDFVSIAKVLLELSFLFENENEEDLDYDYWEDVYHYMDDVKNNKILPKCPEFIEYFKEYTDNSEN